MNTKQVIVWRNDLKVRKGKIAAQCAHASMAFLTKGGKVVSGRDANWFISAPFMEDYTEVNHWLENSFRKICVYVNSEEELRELHQKALDNGLRSNLIEDNGATEFNGVKTLTALAIGPNWDDKFIGITDQLPLL
jgi:peptidyl-tRNA hydrolase, PTH2 family